MLIDWFTVGAQAFNFVVLVWLLNRFLYAPVLGAIDARDQLIAKELQDAQAGKAQAQSEKDDLRGKLKALEERREGLLSEATAQAQTERERLLEAARGEAAALRAKLQATAERERVEGERAVATRVEQEVFAMAQRALTDLADVSLNERIANQFIARLQDLSEDDRGQLRGAPALLRSAFVLPPAQRAALKALLGPEAKLQFELRPELVAGIELTSNGHKLAWSIAGYLAAWATQVEALHAS